MSEVHNLHESPLMFQIICIYLYSTKPEDFSALWSDLQIITRSLYVIPVGSPSLTKLLHFPHPVFLRFKTIFNIPRSLFQVHIC